MLIDQLPIAERFMRYVQIDTQSDPDSTSFPSTDKQINLAKLLVEELKVMGILQVSLDAQGYVMATIPSNTAAQKPVLCFCAHMDTAPDCSGTDVKPILHKNYNGQSLVLPDDHSQVISTMVSKWAHQLQSSTRARWLLIFGAGIASWNVHLNGRATPL